MDNDLVLKLAIERWEGPFSPDIQATALTALEAGRVIAFPQLPFVLADPERSLLSASALDNSRKNISFDPATGIVHGTALDGEERGSSRPCSIASPGRPKRCCTA